MTLAFVKKESVKAEEDVYTYFCFKGFQIYLTSLAAYFVV